jgi:hypothetical protein
MRYLYLALIILPRILSAQTHVYVNPVMGTYLMKDLKLLQKELNDDYNEQGIQAKTVLSFPISLQIDGGFDIALSEKVSLGGFVNYAKTSGKVHYADYSGETYAMQQLSRVSVGAKVIRSLGRHFDFYGKLGVNFNTLHLDFFIQLENSPPDQNNYVFKALGISAEPGFRYIYPIGRFTFYSNLGIEVNVQGKTVLKDNKDAYLQLQDGGPVNIDWTGIRFGLGLAYKILE